MTAKKSKAVNFIVKYRADAGCALRIMRRRLKNRAFVGRKRDLTLLQRQLARFLYFHLTEYATKCTFIKVKVIQIYKCLCDELRLRIVNLLNHGPLCVCHLLEILDCDQVKMSKQLRYMKELGMVEGERQAQWIVYRLASPSHPVLAENLKCLQDCIGEEFSFQDDLNRRGKVVERLRLAPSGCSELLLAEQLAFC